MMTAIRCHINVRKDIFEIGPKDGISGLVVIERKIDKSAEMIDQRQEWIFLIRPWLQKRLCKGSLKRQSGIVRKTRTNNIDMLA